MFLTLSKQDKLDSARAKRHHAAGFAEGLRYALDLAQDYSKERVIKRLRVDVVLADDALTKAMDAVDEAVSEVHDVN